MDVNDRVIFYSPKQTFAGNEPLQAFTAIGRVADDKIYQHKMAENFIPYRRNINYYKSTDSPIAPLINHLGFIKNKSSWGYQFRFGFFEIPEEDFKLIYSTMVD